jgi:adenine-specific DNA methylase
MSYGAFSSRNSNLCSNKQNEYIMISSLINEIKNSEQIRMKIYCINDIISDELFNILHKIISFYFQLSRLIKNLQNYDKFFKQNKNEINMEIRKFLDKIIILNKSKYNYSIFKIEEQENFSIFPLKKKKNKIKNKSIKII